jgi:hypothetical protein
MSATIEAYGFVKSGQLHLLSRERLLDQLRTFKDCDVRVIIKRKGKRSLPQNRYYFGVVLNEIRLALLERGYRYDIDQLHEWAKQTFNKEKIEIEATGEQLEIGGSTTEMNKDEFSSYVDRIREWAALSLEITIPNPGEQEALFD